MEKKSKILKWKDGNRNVEGKQGIVLTKIKFEKIVEKWENAENGIKVDIMNSPDTKEVADVHIVGRIDREIYKCITEDIVTDEVIITDERIEHIYY